RRHHGHRRAGLRRPQDRSYRGAPDAVSDRARDVPVVDAARDAGPRVLRPRASAAGRGNRSDGKTVNHTVDLTGNFAGGLHDVRSEAAKQGPLAVDVATGATVVLRSLS